MVAAHKFMDLLLTLYGFAFLLEIIDPPSDLMMKGLAVWILTEALGIKACLLEAAEVRENT